VLINLFGEWSHLFDFWAFNAEKAGEEVEKGSKNITSQAGMI